MGVYFSAHWEHEGNDYVDLEVLNAALNTNYEAIDLAAYKLLDTIYGTIHNQDLGYNRYMALSNHPMYQFFGANPKAHFFDWYSYKEMDCCGITYNPEHIKDFVKACNWDEAVLEHITHLTYG